VRQEVEAGRAKRVALVGRTAADVRDTMVEGESGLIAKSSPRCRPRWFPSKRRLVWPNGAIATSYSSDVPDQLRGPQHHIAWCDEIASYVYPAETWSNLLFGLRLGDRPRVVVTTTPRPIRIVRELLAERTTATTRGRTYDNAANLAHVFIDAVIRKYEGTRLGRQELEGLVLDDVPGALWTRAMLDGPGFLVREAPELRRVVVAIDPAVSSGEGSDETGIVVVGVGRGEKGRERGYVLADLSGRYSPSEWARKAIDAFERFKADRIVAEVNNGGDLVEANLRAAEGGKSVPYTAVHASRGKTIRAEPVSALYEQGRIHHVGAFPALEDQLCSWDSTGDEKSPDRLDALVWGLTHLMLASSAQAPGDPRGSDARRASFPKLRT
jgi:phage terminase large subunit-like protein